MSLISAHNIEKVYADGTRAVRGVSFDIEEGEFVAIMGPSGSGKSTILHVLGFLDRPSGGAYHFRGKESREFSDHDLAVLRNKEMGFVFQMFNLVPRMSVYQNVRLPLLYSEHKESVWDKTVRHYVHAVGLSHRLDYDVTKLSGGERQRVAIARALVNDPKIVFADEPTGNLDSHSGAVVMDFIESLHKEGRTVILITHDAYVAKYARRILHVVDGEIRTS
jgi:putative ABC transport system ATP-binding protein